MQVTRPGSPKQTTRIKARLVSDRDHNKGAPSKLCLGGVCSSSHTAKFLGYISAYRNPSVLPT
jgi:hypothetical protein